MYANQIASTWLNKCFGYWAKINPIHFDVNEIDANPSNGIRIEGKWEWRAHMKARNPIQMVRWQVSVFKINEISLSILEQPIYHSTNGPLSGASQNQLNTTNNGPPIKKSTNASSTHLSTFEQLCLASANIFFLATPCTEYGRLQCTAVRECQCPWFLQSTLIDGVQVDGCLLFGLAARKECDACNNPIGCVNICSIRGAYSF